ncbi:YbbR-like domain-containing protein [Kordia jejudonensis]|uniref:hypothetical protein n=1 Tax=Kordia jejudonensis TaxID=1348245 RepID=UPI0012E06DCB|nr:hypothetical protein [Kordia jejudonensis]
MLWTLIKLSNTYTDTIKMNVTYTNLSDDKILLGSQENIVEAQVKTTGFRMLRQKFFKSTVEVDLKKVNKFKEAETFYVLADDAINKHLYQETEILKVSPDTLFFKLGKNKTKEVPVVHQLALAFEKGYNLYDSLRIEPKTITISGPEDIVDAQKVVFTEIKQIEAINKDIELDVKLLKNDSLQRLTYNTEKVKAIAKVDKFTEGKLNIPLQVTNLPKGYSIKLFPKEVTVTFTANISDFDQITENDFSIFCDYKEVENTEASFLIPKLGKLPPKVKTYRIDTKKVNFLIKK